jgi:AcrR family transcriptional regulator
MNNKTYHHGNLKQTLIEAGITCINEEGINALSLRKVAKKCGVSNTAPYAHFENKELFLNEIYIYIEDKFFDVLKSITKEYSNHPELILRMGEQYVTFFVENPHYYYFLFSEGNIQTNFSLRLFDKSSNRPLELFKKVSIEELSKSGMPPEEIQNKYISMWALVHGLASIAIMPTMTLEVDWKLKAREIIQSIVPPYSFE